MRGRFYATDGTVTDSSKSVPTGVAYFDLERIARNAELFLKYESEKRGVFALPQRVVHPDTIVPSYIDAPGLEDALFKCVVACGDRRNRSEWVWLRARQYFAEHELTEIPSWNEEQRLRFADTVNSGLRDKQDGGVTYDPRPVYSTLKRHWTRGRIDVPASALAQDLQALYGVGEQVARAAAQWLGDAGYLELDTAFIAKVDLHDIRHMIIGGELMLNGAKPHHKTLDSNGGEARKRSADQYGFDLPRLKKAVWAVFRDISNTYDRRKGADRLSEAVRILSTYPDIWDNLGFWRRGKGHKVQKARKVLDQLDLLEERQLESPGTYMQVKQLPLERVQDLVNPSCNPLTPQAYLSEGLFTAYVQEGLLPAPTSHQLHLLSA